MRIAARRYFSSISGLVVATAMAGAAFATGELQSIADQAISGPVWIETGQWRGKIQQVFDARTRTLVRRAYEVWDPEPSRDLDFVWTPDRPEFDRSGRINGSGHLVWRLKGLPIYDRNSTFAEYRGTLRRGRIEGRGNYLDRSRLYYEGEWRDGWMHGRGKLILPSGDEYEGEFRRGRAHGAGRFIDITGEIYEGQFVDGHRHSLGTTTLPNGHRYSSAWIAGKEIEASYRLRLAQTGNKGVPGVIDDIRIGVTIDRRLPPLPKDGYRSDKGDLFYSVVNSANGLAIRPDDKRLMSVWKGGGEIQLKEDEIRPLGIEEYGVLSLVKGQLVPLTLMLEVQNRTSVRQQVTGAYLDVRRSVTDTKPAIQLRLTEREELARVTDCNGSSFRSVLRFENFGWSSAENAKIDLSFHAPENKQRPARLDHSHSVGSIRQTLHFNLESQLRALGVDAAALIAAEKRGGLHCRVGNMSGGLAQCKRDLLGSRIFGSLAGKLRMADYGGIYVHVVGNLSYDWKQQDGAVRNTVSPFTLDVGLGKLPITAECGEGGEREIVAQKPLTLQLDRNAYRVPVAFQTSIPPGQVARYPMTLSVGKSSHHEFEIVLQMSDGSVKRSRLLDLIYYRPSWFHSERSNRRTSAANVPSSPSSYSVPDSISGGVLNMRRGPGTGHALVVAIPKGSSGVEVDSCRAPDDGQSGFDWCNVKWGSYTGWVSSNGLIDPQSGRRPQ